MNYLSYARIFSLAALITMITNNIEPSYPTQGLLWAAVMFYEWAKRDRK